jgi:hypothetical protein
VTNSGRGWSYVQLKEAATRLRDLRGALEGARAAREGMETALKGAGLQHVLTQARQVGGVVVVMVVVISIMAVWRYALGFTSMECLVFSRADCPGPTYKKSGFTARIPKAADHVTPWLFPPI